MNPVEQLAEHVTRTRYEDLTPEAVAKTKTFVLDTFGVGVAGSWEPWAGKLAALAGTWGTGEQAPVWVHGTRLPAASAVLVNAFQVHCLEFDCVHDRAVVHPMACVLPAVMAWAGKNRAGKNRAGRNGSATGGADGGTDGRAFLLAVALGVDVATIVGQAATGPIRFFRPATAGGFGAVAALGKLEGLDTEALVNAFGILYGQTSGTLQPHAEGSPLLPMQMGFNARAALTAVDLARAGLVGPHDVLVGQYGYFPLMEHGEFDLEPAFSKLGKEWQITRVSHKPYPSGRLTHSVIDGVLRLQQREGFAHGDVESVLARVPNLPFRLVGRPDVPDPSPNYARLCAPFTAATALVRGTVDVPDFRGERLGDPVVHDLARRVEIVEDGNPDPNAINPQTIEVRLKNGATHGIVLEQSPGHPDAALSEEQNREKFRRCWGYGAKPLPVEAGEEMIRRVAALETLDGVLRLSGLLVP